MLAQAALALYPPGYLLVGPESAHLLQGMHWSNRLGYFLIANAPFYTATALKVAAPLMSAAPGLARLLRDGSNRLLHAARVVGGLSLQDWLKASGSTAAAALTGLPLPDRQLLTEQPQLLLDVLPQMLAESVCQSTTRSRGLLVDMRLTTLPWPIDLSTITAKTLIFQGDKDINVTVSQAKWLQQRIGSKGAAALCVIPGATHMSLIAKHQQQIMDGIWRDVMGYEQLPVH